MDIFIANKGKTTLNERNHFKSQGGEGKIYEKGDTIFKIYHEKSKMIPEKKFKELSVFQMNNIIKPEDLIFNSSNEPIGFTMRSVKKSEPLCKLFTNSFHAEHQIESKQLMHLIDNMVQTITHIHDKKCLLVDLNEFNFLIDKKLSEVYFIDVDSYQTPTYPATAVMPNIRDYSSKDFSILSDWYSFAIIACQILIGIHPFKGSHPDYSKKDLIKRMQNNVSIFNKKSTLPATARDFSLIPSNYLEWFIRLFEQGKRELPPGDTSVKAIRKSMQKIIKTSEKFRIDFITEIAENILNVQMINGYSIFQTADSTYLEKTKCKKSIIVFSNKSNAPVFCSVADEKFEYYSRGKITNINFNANKITLIDEHLFVIYGDKLSAIVFEEFNGTIMPSIKNSFNILPNSTVYKGVLLSEGLGSKYLVIPHFQEGKAKCVSKMIPELNDYQIVDAKRDKNIVVVLGFKQGNYDKLIFKFDENFDSYTWFGSADTNQDINFINLGKVALMIEEDGKIIGFESKSASSSALEIIEDPAVNSRMQLVNLNGKAGLFLENKLYSITRK